MTFSLPLSLFIFYCKLFKLKFNSLFLSPSFHIRIRIHITLEKGTISFGFFCGPPGIFKFDLSLSQYQVYTYYIRVVLTRINLILTYTLPFFHQEMNTNLMICEEESYLSFSIIS